MADPIGSFSGLASGIQWADMVDQMMQIEIQRTFTPVQNQVDAAEERRDAWNSFSGLLSKFSASARVLQDGSAFGALTTSIGNGPAGTPLFSATTSAAATPGAYQVKVVDLARAEKLAGGASATTSEPLGFSGEFIVNGKRVSVAVTDTLTSIRNAINATNTGGAPSGVSATILSTSATEHRLVLTSDATGTRGIELADGGSGVLQSLGITTGAVVQNVKPGEAGSTQTQRFSSDSSPLAGMLGVSSPPATTTIEIDGQKITVDLQNDTLLSLMNKVAAQGASVETEMVGSKEMYRLTVSGSVVADADALDPAASQRVVELLGFQTGERASQITVGEDAVVEIDGFEISRRSNVISDAIGGVTLNLTAEDAGVATDFVISRDLGAVVNAAEEMASAYNELVKFANDQRSAGAPLASNGSLLSMMNSVKRTLLGGVSALPTTNGYTHASLVGVELTKDGTLKVDAAKLKSTLETNFADVQALLTTSSSVTDGQVTFISGGKSVQPGGYAIDITSPATRGTTLGSGWGDPAAYAATDGVSDTLTLTDASSGKTIDYTLAQGASLADVVTGLNVRFSSENARLTAVAEGGALRISATEYGSNASFTIAGTAAAQLGLTAGSVAGTDVAGTIGGLAATGSGRTLTGADGGATEGLIIQYTGTTARAAGEVRYVLGVGGLLDRVVEPTIRTNDGVIAMQISSIDRSIVTMNKRLDDIETRLEVRRQALIAQFTRMETAMSMLQSQSTWLTSQIQALPVGGTE
jgi:flagellar hook-associated protein 2